MIFGESSTRKWLAMGGSTSASIVGRIRSKYPHLIEVAMGDSPVLEVKNDFSEFDQKEARTIASYEGCLPDMQEIVNSTSDNPPTELLEMFDGREDMRADEFENFIIDLLMWIVSTGSGQELCESF